MRKLIKKILKESDDLEWIKDVKSNQDIAQETAEERERRLRQLGESIHEAMYRVWVMGRMDFDFTSLYPTIPYVNLEVDINPCAEIMITSSQRCTLGDNPLIKYNEYKFNF
ncbi:unnamed protein product [marine sediment metagenome]|uniref:Uncharacterized protein n=1 Tax=marine sediment metagenome TaxID=412755 RepID=X0YXZ2_9ZZZZ